MPTTIITGATSGIGLETAKGLGKKLWDYSEEILSKYL
jgi:NAD(P)-dependent dehydrogenase (short-subunit alcohol dehydrogenase family)